MAYIKRDGQGNIIGQSRWPHADHPERIADDSPEMTTFMAQADDVSADDLVDNRTADPVLSSLIDDIAELKGETRQDTIARMKGRR